MIKRIILTLTSSFTISICQTTELITFVAKLTYVSLFKQAQLSTDLLWELGAIIRPKRAALIMGLQTAQARTDTSRRRKVMAVQFVSGDLTSNRIRMLFSDWVLVVFDASNIAIMDLELKDYRSGSFKLEVKICIIENSINLKNQFLCQNILTSLANREWNFSIYG